MDIAWNVLTSDLSYQLNNPISIVCFIHKDLDCRNLKIELPHRKHLGRMVLNQPTFQSIGEVIDLSLDSGYPRMLKLYNIGLNGCGF